MKIAIIGVGNLGYSIASGILNQDSIEYKSLYLSKRNIDSLKSWRELPKVTITTDNKEAMKKSELIIIAVQPNQLTDVLNEIKYYINSLCIASHFIKKILSLCLF